MTSLEWGDDKLRSSEIVFHLFIENIPNINISWVFNIISLILQFPEHLDIYKIFNIYI